MSAALRIGFFTLLLLTLSVLFLPQAYDYIADFTLKQAGTYEKIQQLDESFAINKITETSQNIWNDIENALSPDEQKEEAESEKFFEDNIYPSLVGITSFVFKASTLIVSLLGLVSITYLSYATGGYGNIEKLKREQKNLNERLKMLEKRMSQFG